MAQLKKGDVFKLEKGMTVYTSIPERFVYQNRSQSMSRASTEVKVGEVRKPSVFPTSGVIDAIVDAAQQCNGLKLPRGAVAQMLEEVINKDLPPSYDTSGLIGEYVVTSAHMDGGGTGMGPHDVYPDGWHITAKKLNKGEYDKGGFVVSFYQSGCFSAMIEDIKPIRKMRESFK